MDLDMSAEITEVLNSELGCAATLTVGAVVTSIRVDFRNMYAALANGSTEWGGSGPYCWAKSTEVATAVQGSTLTISSVVWKVNTIEAEGTGWTRLGLYR